MKSLTPEAMEARVARFDKLQTYQRQNFEAYGIPAGAVEKITARRVYPVMAPADYQGRSAGAPVKGPRGLIVSIAECEPDMAMAFMGGIERTAEQADPISYAPSLAKEIADEYGKSALEGLQKIGFKFEDQPAS